MHTISLSEYELAEIAGGDETTALAWGVGFLAGLNPMGVLVAVGAAAISLASDYSAYQAGVSAGYDAYGV